MRDFTKNRLLLTGATGILGSRLLKLLLEETEGQVFCLVRGATPADGKTRLQTSLGHYDPKGTFDATLWDRVIPVCGDVALPHLGLSPEAYDDLATKVDAVVHVAALTDLFLNFRRIEPVNVGGTRNIVQFTLKTANRYLCHVSTHTVMGDKAFDPTLVYKETDLDVGQGFDSLSYQRSKFIGEQLVRSTEGLVWNIFRPGQIFGDSKDGAYPLGQSQITGLFYDILKTITETNYAFLSRVHFDVVPVDYVSRGILELGLRHPNRYQTYHLINPDIRRYEDVVRTVIALGYPISIIPQSEYETMLEARTILRDGQEYKSATTSAFRWWFRRGIRFESGGVTDCAFTAKELASRGVTCPPVDTNLLGTYFTAGIAQGYFIKPPPKRAVGVRSAEVSA